MYRLVDCDTWNDPWFESLEPQAKLFFLYLITNPRSTSCGAFEISERKMAFETGIAADDIRTWLREWAPRVMWWPEHNVVWLRNFFRRQGNQNEKTRINARRLVSDLPACIQDAIGKEYPELALPSNRVSIPDAYPRHQKSNNIGNRNNNSNSNNNSDQAREEIPAHPVDDDAAARLPSTTTRPVANGRCAFPDAVGAEKFAKYADRFAEVNIQLGPSWLRKTICRYEAEGLGLPPPAMVRALEIACARISDGLGRDDNTIRNPPAWAATQIGEAIRDEAAKVSA